MAGKNSVSLPVLIGVLVLQAAIETTAIKKHHLNNCHGNNIVINCPPFVRVESGKVEMSWQYNMMKTAMAWKTIAKINSKGNMETFTNNTHLEGRLTIHRNGSLEIPSLKQEDERLYRCQVIKTSSGKREMHFVEVKLTCDGGSKITTRQVCTETDVLIDCKPNKKIDPKALITWRKKNTQGNLLSWSRISNTNTTLVHSNGSLWIRGGRYEGDKVYRCEAVKELKGSTKVMHLTVVKDIVCRREKRQADPSKHHVTACFGDKVWLPCTALQHVNISQVRLVKWRARRTGGPKHWKELAHLKTRNPTDNLHNVTRFYEVKVDGVGLEPNGSLWVQNVSRVNEGDFECIVKTHHNNETKRSSLHLIPTSCNHGDHIVPTIELAVTPQATETNKNTSQANQTSKSTPNDTQTSKPLPQAIQTSTPTPQATHTSKLTPQATNTSKPTPQGNQTSTTIKHDFMRSIQNSATRILLGPSMTTTTTTLSVDKPTVTQVQTTVVTTVTTSITTADIPKARKQVQSDDVISTGSKTVCGGILTTVSGGFQSPNFPSSYPANSYCKWTISVPQDYAAIDITLDNLNLEHEENCQSDYIAVYDELGNQVGSRHCGVHDAPITVHVHGRKAVVEFKSDHSVEKTGFKLIYQGMQLSGK